MMGQSFACEGHGLSIDEQTVVGTQRLAGRTALITGAGRGIGEHLAARFAVESARVVVTDRDPAAARAAAAAFPDAIAIEMDISDESSVEAAFAAVAGRGFDVDVVVANAGVQLFGQDAKIADLDLEVWNRTVEVNLTGTS
jgi:NAD(P)-dependent dehydrogenase (short-subunit alcohol dehydrogenase family)